VEVKPMMSPSLKQMVTVTDRRVITDLHSLASLPFALHWGLGQVEAAARAPEATSSPPRSPPPSSPPRGRFAAPVASPCEIPRVLLVIID